MFPCRSFLKCAGDNRSNATESFDVTAVCFLEQRESAASGFAPSATTTMLNFAPKLSRSRRRATTLSTS